MRWDIAEVKVTRCHVTWHRLVDWMILEHSSGVRRCQLLCTGACALLTVQRYLLPASHS